MFRVNSPLPRRLTVLLLLVGGCAHLTPRHALPPARAVPQELIAYYGYPSPPTDVTVTPLSTQRSWRESLVAFPLSVPEGLEPTEPVVAFEWFESARPGRRPALVFNPILGGDYPLERGICRFFAARGYHVALIHRKTLKVSPEHPIERMELLLRQGVIRARQVVDWMERQERVDPQRMGSFGISMGGMISTMTAAVEPRLKIHVVALAGGGLPDILMSSHDTLLTKPMARYLSRNHMDKATLERRLRQSVKTDPILLAPYVDSSRVLMIMARLDRTIGWANAQRLWQALGRPEAVVLPFGHYTSYIALPYIKYKALRYFNHRL